MFRKVQLLEFGSLVKGVAEIVCLKKIGSIYKHGIHLPLSKQKRIYILKNIPRFSLQHPVLA